MRFPGLTPLLIIPFLFTSTLNTTTTNMSSAFHFMELLSSLSKSELQPSDLVPEGWKPLTELKISFAGKDVRLGNYFKTKETLEAPVVEFALAGEEGTNYTLFLVDRDAPTRENSEFKYWRHWILAGLQPAPGPAKQTKLALTDYLGPGVKDTIATPHRYIFLLFKEPADFSTKLKLDDVGEKDFKARRSFQVHKFAKSYGLELVGVNWFSGVGDTFVEPITLEME